MKNFILSLALLCLGTSLFAQDSPEKKSGGHEIGLNFTYFFKQFVNLGGDQNFGNVPYMLSYKNKKEKRALRMGLGLGLTNQRQKDKDGDVEKTTGVSFDYRIGLERRIPIKEKFVTYFGGDFIIGADVANRKSDDNSTENSSNSFNFGLGPVVGIEYLINDRLSLSTEGTFYLNQNIGRQKVSSGNTTLIDEKTSGLNFRYGVPISLFLNVKF